jgi:hypothetical protein
MTCTCTVGVACAQHVAEYIAKRQPARLANGLKDCKDWIEQEVKLGRDRAVVRAELQAQISKL